MALFNLNSTNTTATTRLQPWTINEVEFKGVELKTGTTKDGSEWKAMQFKFGGKNGIFEPMVFCPKPDGDKRLTGETGGKAWEMPSQMEQLMFTIAHVCGVLAPTNLEKLRKVSLNLPEEFEKLVDLVKKALSSAVGKTTNIKLIGDSRGYTSIPNFIKINRDTKEAYIYNNWLGESLAFNASELKKMEAAKNTKPTPIKSSEFDSTPEDSKEDDIDFDI